MTGNRGDPRPRGWSRLAPFLALFLLVPLAAADGSSVSGVVVAPDGDPVPGAKVSLVEAGLETVTDDAGRFRFDAVPRGRHTLGVHAEGFGAVHRSIDVPAPEEISIRLEEHVHFDEEVTVTALPWAIKPLETAHAIDQIDQQQIRGESRNSIGEAIERVPGVANIGTGDALGTPVIRGISENRIRVLNDGVAANHQQWSARHAPNIEPAFAERVEVVRGPASVMWGPDAMGGVVNIVHAPLPSVPEGTSLLDGEVGLGYLGNNGQAQGQLALEGAFGGFGWRLDGVLRDAGDAETPRGTLENTDYRQASGSASVGYAGSWGTSRVRWSHWQNETGFYFPPGHPSEGFRLDLDDDTIVAEVRLATAAGDFDAVLARQDNVRKTFNPASPLHPSAAVDLRLDTTTARAGFGHKPLGKIRGSVAAEYRGVTNDTRASTLLPDYDETGYSFMILEEARFVPFRDAAFERFILTLGARWDSTDLSIPRDPSNPAVPDGFDASYGAATGSFGLVFRATPELSFAAGAGRGWRPPNAFELFARGEHGGIAAYQVGNPDLEEESNLGTELSARWSSTHVRSVVTVFRSSFDDYIYLYDTGEVDGPSGLPVFSYAQADAVLDGVEVSLEVVPLESLELGVVYSTLDSENRATGSRLPQMPPDRLGMTIRGSGLALGRLNAPFLELEGVFVDDGIPSGPDEPYFGTGNAATDDYVLLHFRAGAKFLVARGAVGLDLAVRNLLDEDYTDFLYPYKGFGVPNPGRDVRISARFLF